MSSVYRVLCLGHDPAIRIDRDWNNAPEAVDAAANPDAHECMEPHRACDLLIGRWSGSIVEIGCPPQSLGDRHGCGRPAHNLAIWVDVDWLRLTHAAILSDPGADMVAALARIGRLCWTRDRVRRLGAEIGGYQ